MELREALVGRRTVRRFLDRPVPRDTVEQLIDAARWAPSACNLQLWEFVVVDDPELRAAIASETRFIELAPVAIFATYSHEYTRENYAWVQSAAAAIQNMMLMAHSLGLGGCWVDTLGNVERLKRLLGIPAEQTIVALTLFGYYDVELKAPRRRPIESMLHWNRFGGEAAWPITDDPDDWSLEQIAAFQMAKIRNGAHYDKPLLSEFEGVKKTVRALLPDGPLRWLDVLPCTGLYTESFARDYPDADLGFVEMSEQVREFVRARSPRSLEELEYSALFETEMASYDVVTCMFRLESLPDAERRRLLARLRELISSEGRLIVAFVNPGSYHSALHRMRGLIGHKGVEYSLAPDPHLGPFGPLGRRGARRLFRDTGWCPASAEHLFAVPPEDEIAYRAGRKGGVVSAAGRGAGLVAAAARPVERFLGAFGRVQVWDLRPE